MLFRSLGYRDTGLVHELRSAQNTLASAQVSFSSDIQIDVLPAAAENIIALALREAITNIIINLLMGGRSYLELNPISNSIPHFDDIIKQIKSAMPRKSSLIDDPLNQRGLIVTYLSNILIQNRIVPDREYGFHLARMLLRVWDRSYIPQTIERYRYESGGGTNMFSDFFLLNQYRSIIERYRYFADNLKDIDFIKLFNITWGVDPSKPGAERMFSRRLHSDLFTAQPAAPKPRINLGSSYKPRLNGSEYYQLKVVEGKTDEEIRSIRRATKREMSAFKAHATMGHYGPIPEKPVVEEPPVTIVEQPKPRKLSLQDIIPNRFSKDAAIGSVKQFRGPRGCDHRVRPAGR